MRHQRITFITATGTIATYCKTCAGVLEYIYHIYYRCRECGRWQKKHW